MIKWLRLESVSFSFGQQIILADASLELDETIRSLAIIGRSGSGKSTLLNLIAGYLKPNNGSIFFEGQIIRDPSPQRPVVFQDHNLFPWMNVIDNVSFGLKARKIRKDIRYKIAEELLYKIGLGSYAGLFPHELSGGMQQRVGLARAMAIEPRCLLLDEPFGSLDNQTKAIVQEHYKNILIKNRIFSIHVTHDLSEAVEYCDAALVLKSPQDHLLLKFDSDPRKTSGEWCAILKREI